MDTTDLNITDSVPAGFLVGEDDLPQIIIDGDPVEVKSAVWGEDEDEVVVKGYSHESGDSVTYTLFADDEFDVWSV